MIACPQKAAIVLLLTFGIGLNSCAAVQAQSKFPASEWMKKDTKFKLQIVKGFIEVAKSNGVMIRFPSEYYVKEVDGIIENSIKNHDEKGLSSSVGIMIHTIAAMDGDWDNGENRLEHAKKFLGPEYFEFFKKQFEQKYSRLLNDRVKYSDPWKHFYHSENTNTYYNQATLSYVSKTVVKVWTKTEYVNAETKTHELHKRGSHRDDAEYYAYDLFLYKIDCSSNRYTPLANYTYRKDETLINAFDFPEKWEAIPPGYAVGEVLYTAVCSESN